MIPEGWKKYTLGDLIEINKVSLKKNSNFDIIEYIDTSSVTENRFSDINIIPFNEAPSRAKRIVRDRDIIYSTVRPIQRHYGFITVPRPNTVVSTGFAVLSSIKIDAKFLYYYLTQDCIVKYFDSIAETNTTTFPAFSPKLFETLEVVIPESTTEQSRIASILSSLDDKIELNLQMNKTLEAIAQAIFKEWFVDFRFPGFDGELVDGLPKGWRKMSLSKIATFLNGLALQKFPPINEIDYLPIIKIRELRQGIDNNSDKASNNLPPEYIVKNGDVLFSWSGSLEVLIWCDGLGALNQHLFKVTSLDYPKWFYYLWTKYHLSYFRRIAESKVTTMGHIQRHHLDEANVNIPTPELMTLADRLFSPLIDKFIINKLEANTLSKLRDNLLPKLMTGKIRVYGRSL